MDSKMQLLQRVPLLATLGRGDIEEIAAITDEVDVPAGRVLTRQGETGEEFFLIVDGQVTIVRDGHHIRDLGPGDYLGEIALVDHGPRSATATAATDARLFVIGHRDFHAFLERYPKVQLQVLQALAERVRNLDPESCT